MDYSKYIDQLFQQGKVEEAMRLIDLQEKAAERAERARTAEREIIERAAEREDRAAERNYNLEMAKLEKGINQPVRMVTPSWHGSPKAVPMNRGNNPQSITRRSPRQSEVGDPTVKIPVITPGQQRVKTPREIIIEGRPPIPPIKRTQKPIPPPKPAGLGARPNREPPRPPKVEEKVEYKPPAFNPNDWVYVYDVSLGNYKPILKKELINNIEQAPDDVLPPGEYPTEAPPAYVEETKNEEAIQLDPVEDDYDRDPLEDYGYRSEEIDTDVSDTEESDTEELIKALVRKFKTKKKIKKPVKPKHPRRKEPEIIPTFDNIEDPWEDDIVEIESDRYNFPPDITLRDIEDIINKQYLPTEDIEIRDLYYDLFPLLKSKLLELMENNLISISYTYDRYLPKKDSNGNDIQVASRKSVWGIPNTLALNTILDEIKAGVEVTSNYNEVYDVVDYYYDIIKSIHIIVRPKPARRNRNKNIGLFPLINTSPLDLRPCQIADTRMTDEEIDKLITPHCLVHALVQSGHIKDNEINYLFGSRHHIPKKELVEIAKITKLCFEVTHYKVNGERLPAEIIGDIFKPHIKLGIWDNHIFINNLSPYNKSAIDHYDEVLQWEVYEGYTMGDNFKWLVYDKYSKKMKINTTTEKADYLYIISKLYKRIFTEDDRINKISLDIDKNKLRPQDIESINDLSQEVIDKYCKIVLETVKQPNSTKSKNKPSIFFAADTEAKTLEDGFMEVINIGWVNMAKMTEDIGGVNTTPISKAKGHNPVTKWLNGITNEMKKGNHKLARVYFHNMKFDINVLLHRYPSHITSICKKDSNYYQVTIRYNGYDIQLVDSYKLLPWPLAKFNAALSLPKSLNKKSGISYDYDYENSPSVISTLDYLQLLNTPEEKDNFKLALANNGYNFDYNPRTETFNPKKYFDYYLRYDVLVLGHGLVTARKLFSEISEKIIGVNIDIFDYLTIARVAHEFFKQGGAYADLAEVSGPVREYLQKFVVGGCVYVNHETRNLELRSEDGNTVIAIDAVSQYPSGIERINEEKGYPTGNPKLITPEELEQINLTKEFPSDWVNYFVKVKINAINKRQDKPIIHIRTGKNSSEYINELTEPVIVYVNNIALEDYIKFCDIDYEVLEGLKFNEGTNNRALKIIRDLFNLRLEAKANNNDAMSELCKLIINSSYGKTIPKPCYTANRIVPNYKADTYRNNNAEIILSEQAINERVTIFTVATIDDAYTLPHIGSLILSMAKRFNNEVTDIMTDLKAPCHYGDTDSMYIDQKDLPAIDAEYYRRYGKVLQGKNMGQYHNDLEIIHNGIKYPAVADRVIFNGKKVYFAELEAIDDPMIRDIKFSCKGVPKQNIKNMVKSLYDGDIINFGKDIGSNGVNIDCIPPNGFSAEYIGILGGIKKRDKLSRTICTKI